MAILTSDIKLLKSAVMADTTDGGGQMTSNVVVDGSSNNLFPDTSAMDRAFGRLQLRKVFGVVNTNNSDTLMGSHAIITDPPDDPLVHCSLMKTSGWADTRTTAKSTIENYMVKSGRYGCRIYDNHFAGALQLRLYTAVTSNTNTFPSGGDAVCIVNPVSAGGQTQYVRVLRTTITTQQVAVTEGSSTVILSCTVCTCDLGTALSFDVVGAPAQRVGITESSFATLYSTVVASGAKFYGVKPLGISATTGEYSVTTSGGVYLPLVPAATIETPIIDQYPMLEYPGISTACTTNLTIQNPANHTWGPNSTVTLPTLISPGTLTCTFGATSFTDGGEGTLYQGATAVGAINYRTGVISLNAGSPSYGAASALSCTYKPASPTGAATHSDLLDITLANQGLSYVKILNPVPAKGTLSLSYMAQGRWYVLMDSLNGKISGADSSYGVGTISYTTGSIAFTLGALPDVGSPIIFQWGDLAAAQPLPVAADSRLHCELNLGEGVYPPSVTATWVSSSVAKTATCNGSGVFSGDATGKSLDGKTFRLEPAAFPDGNVTVSYSVFQTGQNTYTTPSSNTIQLSQFPVSPGSLRLSMSMDQQSGFSPVTGYVLNLIDDGSGVITGYPSAVGTINYATGLITLTTNPSISGTQVHHHSRQVWFHTDEWITTEWETHSMSWAPTSTGVVSLSYSGGVTAPTNKIVVPAFKMQLPITQDVKVSTTGMVLQIGGELYTSYGGQLRKGWTILSGTATDSSAGTVSSTGVITVSVPPTSKTNSVTVVNASVDTTYGRLISGVFRTNTAPLKTGSFQISDGVFTGTANDNGDITGDITGFVDTQRGYVKWSLWNVWNGNNSSSIVPSTLRYNTVFLQYLPLDPVLLGIETARLPLDGKVPIYRSGDLVVVHNTQTYTLPNPLTKDNAYNLGRVRIATVRVKDNAGTLVPDTLYTTNLDAGTIVFPTASNISAYQQPFKVEHRIEDLLLCSQVDISGQLKFTRSLTHDFPAGSSYVSSALPFGDLFSRVYNYFEQTTWSGTWSNTTTGAPTANFNEAAYPIVVTNAGAITERWALVFTNTTTFNIIGETVGQLQGTGNTSTPAAPINPATGQPYFTVPAAGWGTGWVAGNCLRFNTDACGIPFWIARTVLQGPATLASDQFTLAFRGDVDTP